MVRPLVALAVGWYLLIPPDGAVPADILEWSHYASYDTAVACEEGKDAYAKRMNVIAAGLPVESQPRMRLFAMKILSGRCIASDDPRLAPKR